MTTDTTIALNKLLAWDGNVRKTEPNKANDELAASIAAHGLLQSLVVRKDKRGKYAVVAGRRRFLALKSLADARTIEPDMEIPCHILDDDADATEISLAENVQREPMHPADEFDAFMALIEGGMPAADVAARFGVTETVVQKRLKLARVNPVLLKAYRKGEMTLQHVTAFAVVDDHAAQERVWKQLSDWQKDDPGIIRDLLTEDEITASDRRVKFVTLRAYEKAGGAVRRDLFSDDEDGVFILDPVLLESLVAKKLEKTANAIRKEGWKWVETRPAFDHSEWSKCQRRYPEASPLGPDLQAEMDSLTAESDALSEFDELDGDQQARFEAISERIDELTNGREEAWPAETLAIAGCVVCLDANGDLDIRYGLIKPEDAPKKTAKTVTRTEADGTVIEDSAEDRPSLSASLVESLTAERSAAINAALLERPDVALAATVHALALQVFYSGSHFDVREDSVLQLRANAASLHRVEGSRASEIIEAASEHWSGRIPGDPTELFSWCLTLDADSLSGLLAFCVAQTVNAVLLKNDRPNCERMTHADLLANALKLDMAARFTPTAENYFSRVSKATIIEALREIKGAVAPAWSGMKKSELASLAEREITGTGWLPAMLRAPVKTPDIDS